MILEWFKRLNEKTFFWYYLHALHNLHNYRSYGRIKNENDKI